MLEIKKYSPVVIFAYDRPKHLMQVIESLKKNKEHEHTHLHIYCDGPRSEANKKNTDLVRNYAETVSGFASVNRVYQHKNLGLSNSIIRGVSELLEKNETIIVLEDDLIVSPYFLNYMNKGLQIYLKQERVICIHGYCYPITEKLPETFFLRGADCWGWATWKRGWKIFNENSEFLLEELKKNKLTDEFNYHGNQLFTEMLEDQILKVNDSWAIRWHASAFLADKLTLHPSKSLVKNIGMDGSGTHIAKTKKYDVAICENEIKYFESEICESNEAKKSFEEYYKRIQGNLIKKRMRRIKRFLFVKLINKIEKIMK